MNEHTADLEKVLENQNNQNGNDESLISNSTLNVSKVFNQDLDRVETEGLDSFVIISGFLWFLWLSYIWCGKVLCPSAFPSVLISQTMKSGIL